MEELLRPESVWIQSLRQLDGSGWEHERTEQSPEVEVVQLDVLPPSTIRQRSSRSPIHQPIYDYALTQVLIISLTPFLTRLLTQPTLPPPSNTSSTSLPSRPTPPFNAFLQTQTQTSRDVRLLWRERRRG